MYIQIRSLLDKRITNILGHRIKEFSVSVSPIGPDNKHGRATRAPNPVLTLDLTKGDSEIVMTSIGRAPLLTVNARKIIVEGATALKIDDTNDIRSYRLPLLNAVVLRPTKEAELTNPNVIGYRLRRRLF